MIQSEAGLNQINSNGDLSNVQSNESKDQDKGIQANVAQGSQVVTEKTPKNEESKRYSSRHDDADSSQRDKPSVGSNSDHNSNKAKKDKLKFGKAKKT